ncbi:MAG: hypothetical protein ACQEP5_05295 [Actinomycetota bacterium]
MSEKELLLKRMKEQIKQWDAEVLSLKKKLDGAEGQTRQKIDADIRKIEDRIVENKEKINNLEKEVEKEERTPPYQR